jgi:LysR family hydrogen peroxide-inducible transcriptional activator
VNLRDLRYVVALAQHRHFGRAAQACHVSQPTLSGQLAKLEAELGVTIFERAGKSVRLTTVGERILEQARATVAAADDVIAVARASRDPLVGPVRLGIIPTLAPYLAPYLLPRAAAELPAAPLMLVEDFTARLMSQLHASELDAALIATAPEHEALEEHVLFDEPFQLAMAVTHPLAMRSRVSMSDIEENRLLLLTDGHCLRDQALDLCDRDSDVASADLRATSLETLLHLAAADYGVTLVPMLAWQARGLRDNRLVGRPISGRAVRRVRLVWRRNAPRQSVLRRLADITRSSVPSGVRKIGQRRKKGSSDHST